MPPTGAASGAAAAPLLGRAAPDAPVVVAAPLPAAELSASAAGTSRLAPELRAWTEWQANPDLPGTERTRHAEQARLPVVKALFAQASVPFPPAELLLRVFKRDRQLEVWASGAPGARAERIATYSICAASGELGPKRHEGDNQVPEGFYHIEYGWPESAFHLSMKVSYPNEADKLREPRSKALGGDIMIHGGCASIGCIAISDERIEEVWVMMKALRSGKVHVHILPARDLHGLLQDERLAEHHAFWSNLDQGNERFEQSHRIADVKVDWHGAYRFE